MLVTASEFFKQAPPHNLVYNVLQRAYMWNYNNSKPKGKYINLLA